MELKPLTSNYPAGQLFRHTDGGYYKFEKAVLFADDQDELIIYKHLWPFEQSDWARRYSEFKEKFTPITPEDYLKVQHTSREELQAQIEATRTARRAAKSK